MIDPRHAGQQTAPRRLVSFFQYLLQAGLIRGALFLSVALGLSAIATGVQLLPLSITLLLAAAGVQKVLTHPHDARCGSASCLSSPAW